MQSVLGSRTRVTEKILLNSPAAASVEALHKTKFTKSNPSFTEMVRVDREGDMLIVVNIPNPHHLVTLNNFA